MLFDSIYPHEDFFPNRSRSSETLLPLYELSLCNILNLLLSWQRYSPGVESISRKPPSLHIHRKQLLTHQVSSWDRGKPATSPGSTSDSTSLALPLHLRQLSPRKSSAPQSHPWELESTSPNSWWCWYSGLFPTKHECAQLFRIVNAFQKGFNWLCPDPSEELPSIAAIALRKTGLK